MQLEQDWHIRMLLLLFIARNHKIEALARVHCSPFWAPKLLSGLERYYLIHKILKFIFAL